MSVWPLPRITFRELSSVNENRPVALLTSEEEWAVLSPHLSLPVLIQAEPARYDQDLFDYLADNLPAQVRVIYAVGGGASIHAAKVVAARHDLPLVIVPTALARDMILTPYALVEEEADGYTRQVWRETGPASEIILDWGIIQAAPPEARGAGIVDVISIVTGLLDWRYSAQKGKNPRAERFVPWAAGVATGLAKEAIKNAAAIGQGDRDALETLLDLLMSAVQLSNQLGHARVCQGGEHYLAGILSTQTSHRLPHAEVVGPCLLLVAALHGQSPAVLHDALANAGVRLDQLKPTDVRLVLNNLAGHLARHTYPYSILNDLDPASEQVGAALDAAGLAVAPETWETPEPETFSGDEAPGPVGISPRVEAPHEHKVAPGDADSGDEQTRPTEGTSDLAPGGLA